MPTDSGFFWHCEELLHGAVKHLCREWSAGLWDRDTIEAALTTLEQAEWELNHTAA